MIVKRYTPPTCTLEITAKISPLSRWWGGPLVKELTFQLHFDDPKTPKEERVSIKGDRSQLELLSETVSNYVQEFLHQPPTSLPLLVSGAVSYEQTNVVEETNQSLVSFPKTPCGEPFDCPSTSLRRPSGQALRASAQGPRSRTVSLQPRGLVSHQLLFGSLATEATAPEVQLTAVQLFDLATALEQCSAELPLLPNLQSSHDRKVIPLWSAAAAAVVLAVGVTATNIKLGNQSQNEADSSYKQSLVVLNEQEQEQGFSPNRTKELDEKESKLAQVPTVPSPAPTLAPTLSKLETLPPPSPVVAPATSHGQKAVSQTPEPSSFGVGAGQTEPPLKSPPVISGDRSGSQSSNVKQEVNNLEPETLTPTLAPNPNLPSSPVPSSAESVINKTEELVLEDDQKNSFAESTGVLPPSPQVDILPEPVPEFTEIPEERATREAREYFQARWKVPEGLNKTLEYRLFLNPNGSIKTVVPLGNAAIIYLKQAQIPLNDKSFVSPLPAGTNPVIRLVLAPDGTVQTFLE